MWWVRLWWESLLLKGVLLKGLLLKGLLLKGLLLEGLLLKGLVWQSLLGIAMATGHTRALIVGSAGLGRREERVQLLLLGAVRRLAGHDDNSGRRHRSGRRACC